MRKPEQRPRPDLSARQARLWLCAIFAAGLLVRALLTLDEPMGANLFSDDNAYLNAAAVFAKTGYVTYARPDMQSGVLGAGMPLLMGFLFTVFGYQPQGLMASHIVFAAIGLCTACGAYQLAALLRTRRAGVIAAALVTLELQLLSTNAVFYTETPYMCLNLFAFTFFLHCAKNWRLRDYLGGVACLCGAAAFKGLALLAPLMVLPLLLWRRVPLKRWLPKAALAAVIFALVFLPWCVRNEVTFGSFSPFPMSQGDQKLLGTYEGIGYPAGTYETDVNALDAEAWDQGYQTDVNARLARRGELAQQRLTQWFQQNPAGLIFTHLVYKPAKLLLEPFYPQSVFGVPARAVRYLWWLSLTLALFGLLIGRFGRVPRREGFYLPALYLLVALFLTAVYVPLSRYNAPHIPFVLVYAAVGLEALWLRLRPGKPTAPEPAEAPRAALPDSGSAPGTAEPSQRSGAAQA